MCQVGQSRWQYFKVSSRLNGQSLSYLGQADSDRVYPAKKVRGRKVQIGGSIHQASAVNMHGKASLLGKFRNLNMDKETPQRFEAEHQKVLSYFLQLPSLEPSYARVEQLC